MKLTPLMEALLRHADIKEISDLVKSCENINERENEGRTALYYAIRFDPKPEIIQFLTDNGADVNNQHELKLTPLITAASSCENIEIIELLIKAGADILHEDVCGWTAANYAILNPNTCVLKYMLKYDANVNRIHRDVSSPLIAGVLDNNSEVVKILLEYGADKSYRDDLGKTAYDYALEQGNKELIDMLRGN